MTLQHKPHIVMPMGWALSVFNQVLPATVECFVGHLRTLNKCVRKEETDGILKTFDELACTLENKGVYLTEPLRESVSQQFFDAVASTMTILHKSTGDPQMLTNECRGPNVSRKRENAHVYAHKPSMHTNKWIQEANDKLKHGNSA